MIIELALTHPCDQTIYWSAGRYFSRPSRPDSTRRRPIRQCPRCRESLGTPFVRAEVAQPVPHNAHRQLQAC